MSLQLAYIGVVNAHYVGVSSTGGVPKIDCTAPDRGRDVYSASSYPPGRKELVAGLGLAFLALPEKEPE